MRATCVVHVMCLDFNIFHFPRITFQRNAGRFVYFIVSYYWPLHVSVHLNYFREKQEQEKTCMKTLVHTVTGMRS